MSGLCRYHGFSKEGVIWQQCLQVYNISSNPHSSAGLGLSSRPHFTDRKPGSRRCQVRSTADLPCQCGQLASSLWTSAPPLQSGWEGWPNSLDTELILQMRSYAEAQHETGKKKKNNRSALIQAGGGHRALLPPVFPPPPGLLGLLRAVWPPRAWVNSSSF